MKIELNENKVFLENQGLKKEIHPFWLRERIDGKDYMDKITQQRLFDPTELKNNIKIDKLNLTDGFLEITFNDGTYNKFSIENILKEFTNNNSTQNIGKVKWDSSFKISNNFCRHSTKLFLSANFYINLCQCYRHGDRHRKFNRSRSSHKRKR